MALVQPGGPGTAQHEPPDGPTLGIPTASGWRSRSEGRFGPRGGVFNLVSGIIGVVVAMFVAWVVIRIVSRFFSDRDSARFPGSVFERLINYEGLWDMLLSTVFIVVTSMALAVVFGSFFAWVMERTDARISWASAIMPMMPLLMLPVAGTIGWVFLLAPNAGFINVLLRNFFGLFDVEMTSGPLNIYSWGGFILLYTAYQIPFAFLMVAAGLRNSDPALEEASRIAGASVFTTLRRVVMPMLKPSFGAAALYIIWFGFSFFSVGIVIGTGMDTKVLAVEIVRIITFDYPSDVGVAIGLSGFLVIALSVAWYFQGRILRQNRNATLGGKGARTAVFRLGRFRRWAQALLIAYFLLTFVFPAVAQMLVALNGFWSPNIRWDQLDFRNLLNGAFGTVPARRSLANSLLLSVVGATIATVLASVLAVYLRGSKSRWARLTDGVIKLPMALSAIVVGLGVLLAFSGPPFNLGGTIWILLIAYVILFLPTATISADAAAAQVDIQLTEASRVAGASGWVTFIRINLPLMIPGLVAVWGLLFVWMTGELNASMMLAGTAVPVVGFQILQIFQIGGDAVLASLSLVITVINAAVLTGAYFLERWLGASTTGKKGKT